MFATNLRILGVVLLTIAVYTLLANSIPQVESEVPEELSFEGEVTAEALVAAGDQLYHGAGGCTACHGLGTRAPNLLADERGTGLIGERCARRVAGQSCKEYLHQSLVEPNAFVVEGYQPIMPDMRRTLSAAQIWSLVAYLESQGGEVTVAAEDVKGEGEGAPPAAQATSARASTTLEPTALLKEFQCMACHRLAGEGGPVGPALDGIGARRRADAIRKKILEPRSDTVKGFEAMAGVMPSTFGEQLSAAQLEALVRYLSARK